MREREIEREREVERERESSPQCLLRTVCNGFLRDVEMKRHLQRERERENSSTHPPIYHRQGGRGEREGPTLNMEQLDWDLS